MVEDQLFDAAQVARQAALRWQDRADAAGRSLRIEGPEPAATGCASTVRGSPTLLGEVVSNLVDNALRYGGPHVAVQTRVQAHEDLVRIQRGAVVADLDADQVLVRRCCCPFGAATMASRKARAWACPSPCAWSSAWAAGWPCTAAPAAGEPASRSICHASTAPAWPT